MALKSPSLAHPLCVLIIGFFYFPTFQKFWFFFVFLYSCGASIAIRDFGRSKWLSRRHFVRTLHGQFVKEDYRYTFYLKNRPAIAFFQKVLTNFVFFCSCGRSIMIRHYIRPRGISRTPKKSEKNKFRATNFSKITNPSNSNSGIWAYNRMSYVGPVIGENTLNLRYLGV